MSSNVKNNTRKIPLGRPFFDQKEVEANDKIFNVQWVLNGPEVRRFEECFKNYAGTAYASAVSSCTAGMHLALSALQIQPGDEVLIPAFNFIADGLSVLQAGAKPVFIEVNEKTGNMDVEDFEKRITKKSRAVLVLHYAGFPANMDAILSISKKHGIKVVEDAAHALGATYGSKKVGNLGDATSFSFGPLKTICTGMGGMVTSNDKAIIDKVNSLRSYGMDKSMWDRKDTERPWSYSVGELGHNFRMTDFQASLGIVQMGKLESFVQTRKKITAQYNDFLKNFDCFEFFEAEKNSDPAPLYYVVKVKSKKQPTLRDELALYLIDKGVGASVHWDPALHVHPLFKKLGYKAGDFPKTEQLAKETVSLPLTPAMTDEDVNYIFDMIKEFLKGRSL